MDAPRLSRSPLRRRRAYGSFLLARAARRAANTPSVPTGPQRAQTPTPLDIDDIARGLVARPAAVAALVALLVAAALHVGVGGASASIRPAKRGARASHNVVVDAANEPLAEDLPPPPPPPPPPPSSSTPALATAPTSSPASSSPSPLAAMAPGLSSSSFGGVGGAGLGAGFAAGGGASGLPSSAPQATAQTTPTITPARAISRPPPRYPPGARRDGVTGVVTLAIEVDETGAIVVVRVVHSEPAGVFDAAAVESVRGWRFQAATREGAPLRSWVRQTIRFSLEAT